MPINSLGSFTFITANVEGIRGAAPPLPHEMVSYFTTPGIDGVAVRNDGAYGTPFRYRTCAHDNAPITLKQIYELTPGQVPQNLVWEATDFDTANVRFTVLEVGEFEINRVSGLVVDGSVIGATYLIWATWLLLPVDMS